MTHIKIIGTPLYQWESGRRVRIIPVLNTTVTAVHFSNYGDTEALSVEPKEENGMIVANIPDIYLQSGANLVVYTVNTSDDGCVETLRDCVFHVRKRAKPSDYIYTEPEKMTWEALDERIKALEQGGGSAGVTSWNDLTDKPEGVGYDDTYEVERLTETTNNFASTMEFAFNTPDSKAGNIYKVMWNGVEYTCEAKAIRGNIIGFGNLKGSGFEDTGEPFVAVNFGYGGFLLSCVDDDARGLATFSVREVVRDIHAIPEKYLPKAAAVDDAAGDTVTADEFNALLTALRNAGYLKT